MNIHCPKCYLAKIKKNGKTHYGKQNHKCKECMRQFVLHNTHSITKQVKSYITYVLKERLSLRAICRVFRVSLTWLQSYCHIIWSKTPKRLGLNKKWFKRIKRLQVFGLQADEMWSFVQYKANKRWIWVAFDPTHRLVIAFHIGGRGIESAKAFKRKIPKQLRSCIFETDDWDAYKSIFEPKKHRIGKDLTYFIEGFYAPVRARVSRLVRKSLSFSKKDKWHKKAIAWFFWQFNLEQQPHI